MLKRKKYNDKINWKIEKVLGKHMVQNVNKEERKMLQVKNVTKRYGSFLAVDNISFEIKDNEIIGFLGPNGAGKSTTMNMITGYIEPTKGKIIVNGKDIA